MERYQGYAATAAGVRSNGALVTVYLASDGISLAQLYSDNLATPTPLANPFAADAAGFFAFYAKNGRYNVRTSAGTPAISPAITFGDNLLADPFDTVAGQLPGQVIDVRAYGALCDGVTDDTAAIRAALAALNTTAGGVLLLPASSTILISDFLQFQAANVEIRGGGPASTILQQTVGNQDVFRCAFGGCSVRDLGITRSVADVSGAACTLTAGADDFLIERVGVTAIGRVLSATTALRLRARHSSFQAPATGGTALTLASSTDALLEDLAILGFDQTLALSAASHRFIGSAWHVEASPAHTGTGFVLANSNDVTLERIIVAGADGFNAGLTATTCDRLRLAGWRYLTPPTAHDVLSLVSCASPRIVDWEVAALPINVGALNFCELTSCSDAEIRDIAGSGGNAFLGATGCQALKLLDCTWLGSASNVVVLTTGSTHWTIAGNYFSGNGQGVTALLDCDYGHAEGNHFLGSTGAFGFGIELFGAKFCEVCDNHCNDNIKYGINIENSGVGDTNFPSYNLIKGNSCSGNGLDGISVQNAYGVSLHSNYCVNNGRNGLLLSATSDCDMTANIARNNAVTDATAVGIAVLAGLRTKIVGNTATRRAATGLTLGSQNYGIFIDVASATGLIDGNLASGNVTANLQNNSASMLSGTNQTT